MAMTTLRQIFSDIANALRRKGVDKEIIHPEEYAELIDGITTGDGSTDTSDATATANDIAYKKTAYGASGKIIGNVVEVPSLSVYSVDELANIMSSLANNTLSLQASTALRLMRPGAYIKLTTQLSSFGDATAADVAVGKTFTSADGYKKVGTLTPQTGTDTSDATVSAADIRKGQIAYGPNGKITGTMPDAGDITGQLGTTSGAQWSSSDPNRGSGSVSITNVNQTAGYTSGFSNGNLNISVPANRLLKGRTITPTTVEQTIAEAEDIAYGAIKVAGASTLIPSNIKKGVSIFNVVGSMESGTDVSDATATAGDIASGKIAYIKNGRVSGTLRDFSSGTDELESYMIGEYSNGLGLMARVSQDTIYRAGTSIRIIDDGDYLGDALAADVAAGKTFTSKYGLKMTGTANSSSYYSFTTSPNSSNLESLVITLPNNITSYSKIIIMLNTVLNPKPNGYDGGFVGTELTINNNNANINFAICMYSLQDSDFGAIYNNSDRLTTSISGKNLTLRLSNSSAYSGKIYFAAYNSYRVIAI